ncbi:MAG: hypothetical protein ACTSUU_00005, partial [Candidatus Thorarchaeota archaeon]
MILWPIRYARLSLLGKGIFKVGRGILTEKDGKAVSREGIFSIAAENAPDSNVRKLRTYRSFRYLIDRRALSKAARICAFFSSQYPRSKS